MTTKDTRARLQDAIKEAMRSKDTLRLSTLRLMSAALKDQDIALRGGDGDDEMTQADITTLFAKMVKQREESATAYEEAGRMELAEREREEQRVIREFLPKPLNEKETETAIGKAIEDTGASSIKDMGKVMGALKARYAGRMDFAKVGGQVRSRLT